MAMQQTRKSELMAAIVRAEEHNIEEALVRRHLKDVLSNSNSANSDFLPSLLGAAREELRTLLYNQAMLDWRSNR
jgi:hypothetical protein